MILQMIKLNTNVNFLQLKFFLQFTCERIVIYGRALRQSYCLNMDVNWTKNEKYVILEESNQLNQTVYEFIVESIRKATIFNL